ncbi:MAG: hypothetical protein ABL967_01475 [Bryobacteraceae bacterium]
MTELTYAYEPYTQFTPDEPSEDCEIPCFRIYGTDYTIIGETNEDLPVEIQERYARLFAAAPKLAHALEYFFNVISDYESSVRKGYIERAKQLARDALADAKGSRS